MEDKVAPAPEAEKHVDPFDLFTPQVRLAVQGLAFIGQLSKQISFCGHTFTLRTLFPAEKAAISIVIKPWRETLAEAEVLANAQVALALTEVDNTTDFCPMAGPDLNDFVQARLNYATKTWYQPTLSFLYARYLELEQEALDGIRELRDLSERNRVPSQPSPDSLSVPDTLGAPVSLVTQP